MRKPKRVKITNNETGQETIYENMVAAAQALDRAYNTIMWWYTDRIHQTKYKIEYIDE